MTSITIWFLTIQYLYKAAVQLRFKYYNECNTTTTDTEFEIFTYLNSIDDSLTAKRMAKIKDTIDHVMKEHELEDDWAEYQNDFSLVFDAINQCNEIDDAADTQE